MKTVTIYTTPYCTFCQRLKEYFHQSGVSFTEFNVLEEPDKLDEMKRFSGGSLSVPVAVFNKNQPDQTVYVGFQPDAMERELT